MRLNHSGKAGFTLIELLVVISIIGLLSSVVLASLASARDKGRIAAGVTFADHNYQGFGADAIGIWNFNEGAGTINVTPAKDISGNNRTMTSVGATISRSNITPLGSGYSLGLSGGSNENLSTGILTSSKDLSPKSITVSVWINSEELDYYHDILFTYSSSSDWPIWVYSEYDKIACDGGMVNWVTYRTDSISPNKWYHFACSIDTKTDKVTLYLDGKQVVNQPLSGFVYGWGSDYISRIHIGGVTPAIAYDPFIGKIDDVAIYTSALTASEVGKLYAEGLKDHPNLAQK